MSGFLDEYGVVEARRERIIKRVLLVGVIVAVVAGGFYLKFHNYREEHRLKTFLNLLETKDYAAAYALWGCTVAKPCPSYSFEKFLQDWGPKSPHAGISVARLTKTYSCADGIIQTLSFGKGNDVWLWVSRNDYTISYAPWPTCHPRLPTSVLQQH